MQTVLVAGGAGYAYLRSTADGGPIEYRFGSIERGTITNVVSSTGKVTAVGEVKISSQVAGQVIEVQFAQSVGQSFLEQLQGKFTALPIVVYGWANEVPKPGKLAAADEARNVRTAKWFTALWGVFAIAFALFASFSENLIEAINILGSLFYGVVLALSGATLLIGLPEPRGALTLASARFQPLATLEQTPDQRRWQTVQLPHQVEILGVNRAAIFLRRSGAGGLPAGPQSITSSPPAWAGARCWAERRSSAACR